MSEKTLLEKIDYYTKRMGAHEGNIQTLLLRVEREREKQKKLQEKIDYFKREISKLKN